MELSKKIFSRELTTVPNENCYISLSGSSWQKSPIGSGLAIEDGCYFDGNISINSETHTPIKIFAIFYEGQDQVQKRRLFNGHTSAKQINFSFSPPFAATKFDIFIHVSPNAKTARFSIKDYVVYMIKSSIKESTP